VTCAGTRAANMWRRSPCRGYITHNETDVISTEQGLELYDQLTCPKVFRRFLQAEGADGHSEGMAPVVVWTAAFDWLDRTLPRRLSLIRRMTAPGA
jgi:hypothetical protein